MGRQEAGMIINIRGTSGAGKTHVVRRLMRSPGADGVIRAPEAVRGPHPERSGREILLGYRHAGVFFVGSYEATCGGCDKFSWKGAADWVQELVRARAVGGDHVVFEGLSVSHWKAERFLQLGSVAPLKVVLLDTTLEDCLAAVRGRREARGVTDELNPANTVDTFYYAKRKMGADIAAGVDVGLLGRDEAYRFCCRELGLTPGAA